MKKPSNGPPSPDFGEAPDAAELERVWESLSDLHEGPSTSPEDTDRAWARVARRIGLPGAESVGEVSDPAPSSPGERGTAPPPEDQRDPGRRPGAEERRFGPSPFWVRVAAVFVLALGGTAAWYAVPHSITTPAGEQRIVSLPDGSTVTLNAGSTLRHRRGFRILPGLPSADRRLRLEGEAFFDVEEDGRPFVVEAGEVTVRVLGTRFDVRARGWSRSGAEVHVEEGRVEVSSVKSAPLRRELAAGESARVTDSGIEALAPRPGGAASWRSGGLTVVDLPLDEVLAELGVRFGIAVTLADDALGDRRLSIYYPALGSLESVLADLSTQQELRFRRTAEGWEIF